jgi:hypothetical protein
MRGSAILPNQHAGNVKSEAFHVEVTIWIASSSIKMADLTVHFPKQGALRPAKNPLIKSFDRRRRWCL